jgi:phosphatidate cytidylyltransferase
VPKKRIITAIFIAIIFSAALFFLESYAFSVFSAVVIVYAGWEWARLSGLLTPPLKLLYAFFVLSILILSGYILGLAKTTPIHLDTAKVLMTWLVPWWAIALLWIQGYPSSAVLWGSRCVRGLMGLLVLVPTWLSIVILTSLDNGKWLVFVVVLIVASADIGAYFSGSRFGKNKLSPNVSPNKTWEGFLGAIIANLCVTFLLGIFLKLNLTEWLMLFFIVMATVLAAVVGDLLESMMKRHRGVKDSGNILPGHGGVLDRVDSLTAALPVFTLIFIYSSFQL